MDSLADLRQFLNSPRRVVLISHRNPDGDAIGSLLGMQRYLETFGHIVSCVVPSEYPLFLSFLQGVEDMLVYDLDPKSCGQALEEAELIGLLDFNALQRIDKLGELLPENTPRFLIDHHLDPEPMAEVIVSDTSASSTCELVFRSIKDMGDLDRMNASIAEAIMTGILTDTGGFSYAIRPRIMREFAELLEFYPNFEFLQDKIFNGYTSKQLSLLGHCLANRMEVFSEHRAALITLTKRDFEQFDIQRGDTEGIVNFLLKMHDIDLAGFITEQQNIVKISLRSKGDVNVQEMAAEHFKGGGHKNASGGYSHAGLRNTVAKFKEVIKSRLVDSSAA